MGTGVAGERPADQRLDDGLSVCFDSEPFVEPMELLGNPVVELALVSDRTQAQVAVRLCDVAPDGSSLRISYAVLNLAHRSGSEKPRPPVPGEPFRAWLTLKMCGHRLPPGHRLRLAVATACWPLVWPARDLATLTLSTAESRLMLPVRAPTANEPVVRFDPPRHGPAAPMTILAESRATRRVTFDLLGDTATVVTEGLGGLFGEGVVRFDEIGTDHAHDLTRTLTVGTDPLSAETRIVQRYAMGREGWRIRIETTTVLTADASAFRLTGELKAYENDVMVRTRDWHETIERRDL